MQKLVCTVVATALALFLVGGPNPAHANNYEESLENCSYPKLFDLTVMRPLSLAVTAAGAAAWVPLGVWTLLTSPTDYDDVTKELVLDPASFTFQRSLGACKGSQFFR